VLSEGGYGKSNSTLEFYAVPGDSVVPNLLGSLGDVGNDIELINSNLYIVLSGSGQILVVRPDTVQKLASLAFTNGEGPNKIVQISATQALVPQLYNPNVSIIDLQSTKVTGVIRVGGGSVGAAVLANKAFVSVGADSLAVCDLSSKSLTKMLHVGDVPWTVFADSAHDQIVVFCQGNYNIPTLPSIYWVKASTMTVIDSTHFGASDYIQNALLANGAFYVFLGDRVATLNLATHAIANNSFVATGYYNGAFDPVANELYFGNAGDFSSNGSVDVLDATAGTKKRSFAAGIAPAHFAFYR
jgi:hypothetical protein